MSLDNRLYNRIHGKGERNSIRAEDVELIIAWLENVQKRPHLFFYPFTSHTVSNGFYFFNMAYCLLNYDTDPKCDVVAERGWESGSMGPTPHMKKIGMSDLQIIDELISIEIARRQKLLEKLTRKSE